MKPHLFLLTIGPVQSFIAQARKTQDLFAGSLLLSHLAATAFDMFQAAAGKENVELLFPAFDMGNAKVRSNPNRFAAEVSSNVTSAQLKEIGSQVKAQLIQKFVHESLARMGFLSETAKKAAKAQLENHLEIYWAAMPLDDENYCEKYKELEQYINGIKNFRDWKQVPEMGRKCNVDGQRNVVVYRKNAAESANPRIPHKLFQGTPASQYLIDTTDEREIPVWSLQAGEGLSAVSYAKRTFKQIAHTFPSTARVCLFNVVNKIKDWPEFEKLELGTKKLLTHSDDQLLFKENIRESVFLNSGVSWRDEHEVRAAIQTVTKQHEVLTKRMRQEDIGGGLNTKYYAILIFDGDQMGKWLQGEYLGDSKQLKAFHQKLRDLLHDFGQWAMENLKAPAGKAVYAGGDDFLGFVNLNHLYTVLKELRQQFDERVNQPLQAEQTAFQVKEKTQFSFSAGIAIGHYKQPLGMVLDEARESEKTAKKSGRNAFAISVMRHSGGVTRSIQPFGPCLVRRIEAMETIHRLLAQKLFSNKFMHNLIAETRYWGKDALATLVEAELKRLVGRAKNDSATDNNLDEMNQSLLRLFRLEDETSEPTTYYRLENFIATLRVIDFVYRITNENEEA